VGLPPLDLRELNNTLETSVVLSPIHDRTGHKRITTLKSVLTSLIGERKGIKTAGVGAMEVKMSPMRINREWQVFRPRQRSKLLSNLISRKKKEQELGTSSFFGIRLFNLSAESCKLGTK
jgi:hypothetical protein